MQSYINISGERRDLQKTVPILALSHPNTDFVAMPPENNRKPEILRRFKGV